MKLMVLLNLASGHTTVSNTLTDKLYTIFHNILTVNSREINLNKIIIYIHSMSYGTRDSLTTRHQLSQDSNYAFSWNNYLYSVDLMVNPPHPRPDFKVHTLKLLTDKLYNNFHIVPIMRSLGKLFK